MSEYPNERGHRTRHARSFLTIAFFLQRIGDAAVIWFTFLPSNETLFLRGVAIGSALCTAVLLVGVWRRLRWARYLLTSFNWAYMALFSFWVLQAWNKFPPGGWSPYLALVLGVVFYGATNFILLRSRRVRHFASR